MKKIIFKELSIRNFLSFGDEPVVLNFDKGLHVVTGVNRDKADRQNAIGKSSMMEALYFAVFGETIRDIKKDLIPNSFTNGTCDVQLTFESVSSSSSDNYKIIRTVNPSKLYFYRNDEDVTRDSIKNTDEYIRGVLNANPAVFENCVIMTLNNTVPFMSKSKIDKRKFIEGIFNLDVFSRMLAKARDDYNDTKRSYEIELTKMEDSEKTIKTLLDQKENVLNSRKNKIKIYEGRKSSNIVELDSLNKEDLKEPTLDLVKLNDQSDKIKKGVSQLEKRIKGLTEKRFQLQSEINSADKTLKKMEGSNDLCPMCKKPLDKHDIKTSEEEKGKILQDISNWRTEVASVITDTEENENKLKLLKKAQTKLNSQISDFKLYENKKENRTFRINQLKQWLQSLDVDIEELKSLTTEIDPILDNQNTILTEVKGIVQKYKGQLNLLDTVKFIVSEEGVKSFIVKKILELFNSKLDFYLKKLDANYRVRFNEFFEEEIVNQAGKVYSYNSFSGEERKMIDIACLFTFIDMRKLQGDTIYNVLVFDELFDSSVDRKGIELINNIIQERSTRYDESIFIISHRKESLSYSSGDPIFLEKKNGITTKIDYNPF